MAFQDLGTKMSEGPEIAPSGRNENKVFYPSFHVNKSSPPPIKVGDSVEARVKLKLTSVSKHDGEGDKYSCSYDVHAIDFGKPGKKSDPEKLESELSRQISDKPEEE